MSASSFEMDIIFIDCEAWKGSVINYEWDSGITRGHKIECKHIEGRAEFSGLGGGGDFCTLLL